MINSLLDVTGCTVKCGPCKLKYLTDSQYYVVLYICCSLEGLLVTDFLTWY